MFVACGIWCLADVSSVSPSSEQSAPKSFEKSLKTTSNLKTSEPGKITHKTGSKISAQRTQRSNEICPWAKNNSDNASSN